MRHKSGMALIAVLATIALISVLTLATLSLSGRLAQGGAAMNADTQLEATATSAVADVLRNWRQLRLGTLAVGSTSTIAFQAAAGPARTTVTRIGPTVFWIVAEATRADDVARRQNLIVRLRLPVVDSLPALVVGGDAIVSSRLSIVSDSVPGCFAAGSDLVTGATAHLTSSDGAMPHLIVARISNPDSAAGVIGRTPLDSLGKHPDLELPGGTVSVVPSGVVHVAGALTLTGGSGSGILIVDGLLQVTGPIQYGGVIVARGGMIVTADGSFIEGSIRTTGASNRLEILGATTLRRSRCATQDVVGQLLMPTLVAGRRWAEMY